MKKIKNKLSFKLFYNDKFVMFFSILVAFIAWIMVASTSEDSTVFTVTDIPVNLPELSNNLEYFSGSEANAEVKISGNALIVTGITKNDINITAQDVSYINKPGEYTVDLVPRKKGIKTDYTFVSTVTPSSLKVFVDILKETEITITDKVSYKKSDSGSLHYSDDKKLSVKTVKVSGPSTIVDKIAEVDAEYEIKDTVTEQVVVNAPLVFRDSSGEIIESPYLKSDISSVNVTIPVQKLVSVKVKPNFINVPDNISDNIDKLYTVTPEVVEVAGQLDEAAPSIETQEIDFSTVSKENSLFSKNKLIIPTGWQVIAGAEEADVAFELSGMEEIELTLDKIKYQNQPKNKTVKLAKPLKITIIGPKEEIKAIKMAQSIDLPVTATADLSKMKQTGASYYNCPVTFAFVDRYKSCWVEGTHSILLVVNDKTSADVETSGNS